MLLTVKAEILFLCFPILQKLLMDIESGPWL